MISPDAPPTQSEVKDQLQWMLSTKRFRNATNQSDFLALVVGRAVQGKKTPGHVIAQDLFPDKFLKTVSTDVRVTASNLRSTLKKYYEQEGDSDLVIISLPEPPADKSLKLAEGQAYTPVFAYNSNHQVSLKLKLGNYFLSRGMYGDFNRAVEHYLEAERLVPNHVGACLGMAEALCMVIRWEGYTPNVQGKDTIMDVATTLDSISHRCRNFWRLYAIGGFMAMLDGNVKGAKASFSKAVTLDRTNTQAYPPYFMCLIETGQPDEGLRLARKYLDARIDNVGAHVCYAEALCKTGNLIDGYGALSNALLMDQNHWAVREALLNCSIGMDRFDEARLHLEKLEELTDPLTFKTLFQETKKLCESVGAPRDWLQDFWPSMPIAAFE